MDENFAVDLQPASLLRLLKDEQVRSAMSQMIRDTLERDVLGRVLGDSFDVDKTRWIAAAFSSGEYAMRKMSRARRLPSAARLLEFALSEMKLDGLMLEFGVYSGNSITTIAKARPDKQIYGFDSFEGLPEEWRPGFGKGAFATHQLPPVPQNVSLQVGWFDRTLPTFCDTLGSEKAAFIHVDCDLYSSTQTVFAQLKNRIVPGTIIIFDEYFNYPGWERHEFKAFHEFIESSGLSYDYIGLVPHHQQVAVRILG